MENPIQRLFLFIKGPPRPSSRAGRSNSAAQVKRAPSRDGIGAGWIHLLSNRVALCQPTVTLKDIHNGNISPLPPHCLNHLFYTKLWKGLMPGMATAPQICWMEVPASTTHTWGGSVGAHCTSPGAGSAACPPLWGHVPPTCLGQAWRCSWRPGVAPPLHPVYAAAPSAAPAPLLKGV